MKIICKNFRKTIAYDAKAMVGSESATLPAVLYIVYNTVNTASVVPPHVVVVIKCVSA